MQGAQGGRIQLPHIVILALFTIFIPEVLGCNTQAIIQSELRTCETLTDGTRLCQLYSTAEMTLPSIHSESCLWFTTKENQHLFSLRIKLDAVTCDFHTKRRYFTFPVTAKHISQVSCIYNEYCGQGVHCIKERTGKQGLHFEAETPESRQWPGVSRCVQGTNTGCFIVTRAACNFYRTWFEPDLLHSYEVSSIMGHSCKYHISVTHIENNTISQIVLTDSAYTDTGIKISVLGAYDQAQLHLNEAFIQRVGRPMEAYIVPACERNTPHAGQIGSVQANQSYTKEFIFDPNLSQCDFFEDRLRCNTVPDPLSNLQNTQEFALPMERHMHLFQIRENKLSSSLLTSSAVRLQLHFKNFKISMQSVTICPKFGDTPFEIRGCYGCPILARMTFSALSTCQAGTVFVHFQNINIHTKAIQLDTDTQLHTVKFIGDQKCFTEKLCLKAQTLIQCKQIEFCLEEPSIELLSLNTNYTIQTSSITTNKWWDWMQFPSLNSSLFLIKLIGSSLFILCLLITTTSTLITCCCRSR